MGCYRAIDEIVVQQSPESPQDELLGGKKCEGNLFIGVTTGSGDKHAMRARRTEQRRKNKNRDIMTF